MMRSVSWVKVAAFTLLFVPFSVLGAELGRIDLTGGGRVSDPGVDRVTGPISTSRSGVELNLLWTSSRWKVEDEKFDGDSWGPELGFFFGVSEYLDLRFMGAYWEAKDESFKVKVGRVGLGGKFWVPTGGRVVPSVSLLFNYYLLKAEHPGIDLDVDDHFGVSLKLGLDYLLSEFWTLGFGVNFNTLLGKTDIKIDGEKEDLSLNSIGFGIGIGYLF